MLTIKMAQQLRVDQTDLQTELKQFEQAHAVAKANKDRKGMVELTKKINSHKERLNRIQEALKDAPVEPWKPQEVWKVIENAFDYQENFEEERIQFLKDINTNIGSTLEWQAAKIVQSEKKSDLTMWIAKLGDIENVQERIEKFYNYLPDFIEQLKEDVLRGARRQTSMSTSESSNLVERARLEATAEVLDNLTNWYGSSINRAKKHFESWKELNQE